MIGFNNAALLSAEEIREELNEEISNPTVQRLCFIETKADPMRPAKASMLFPCYITAYTEEPELLFKCSLTQYINGSFGMVEVILKASELGIDKRIWDRPPTKIAREDAPWVDSEVPQ